MKKELSLAYIAIAIGVVSLALSAIFVKLSESPSGLTAFYRMAITVLIMLPFFVRNNISELFRFTKKDWVICTAAGTLLALHFILWFESLNYTSVASSTVLVTLQPLFAFIGTYFIFHEKVSSKTIIAGVVAIAGSVLISWGDFQLSGSAFCGDVLALVACALVTGYFLLGQSVRGHISLTSYSIVVYSTSTVVLMIYVLIFEGTFIPVEKMDWLYFVLLAVIPNILGHNLFNWAIKWVGANTISMTILLEPVGATVLAFILFDEHLRASQVIGGIVVLIGLTLFLLDYKRLKNFFKKTS